MDEWRSTRTDTTSWKRRGPFLDDPEAETADDEEITAEAADADEAAALRAEVADLKDRLLRALADVENIRKRAERDRRDAEIYGATRFARDLLSVHDNFDRALGNVTDEVRAAAPGLIEGIELTQRDLLNAFEKHKIVQIEPQAGRPLRPQAAPGDVRGAGARHQGRRHHPGHGRRLHHRRPPAAPRPGRRLLRRPGDAAAPQSGDAAS